MSDLKFLMNDPAADYRELRPEMDRAIAAAVASGAYIQGPPVRAFEEAFAKVAGAQYAVGVATGTDAIRLALIAAEIGPGAEVITAANTFIATAIAIVEAGARPVLVDVDPHTLLIDPALAADAVTERTRAVVPVHLYGLCADMDPISEFCDGRGLAVIEDACQAHGAEYKGRRAGSLGRAAAFSFYPTKNLGGLGDGGMVTTNDRALAEKTRMIASYGSTVKDEHEVMGANSRLDSIQAAALLAKLPMLEKWNQRRRENAAVYDEMFAKRDDIETPAWPEGRLHVYHQYVIRVRAEVRDRLRERLFAGGIPTMVHYPTPIHLQPAFSYLEMRPGDCPVCEDASRRMISLPVAQHVTTDQTRETAEAVLYELKKTGG